MIITDLVCCRRCFGLVFYYLQLQIAIRITTELKFQAIIAFQSIFFIIFDVTICVIANASYCYFRAL